VYRALWARLINRPKPIKAHKWPATASGALPHTQTARSGQTLGEWCASINLSGVTKATAASIGTGAFATGSLWRGCTLRPVVNGTHGARRRHGVDGGVTTAAAVTGTLDDAVDDARNAYPRHLRSRHIRASASY